MRTKFYRMISYGFLTAIVAAGGAFGLGDSPTRSTGKERTDSPQFRRPQPLPVAEEKPVVLTGYLADPQADRKLNSAEPARQEAAVSLEWSGPSSLKVHERGEYVLNVRNTSTQAVQKVVVQVRVPRDAAVARTEPAARAADGVHVWELGTMEPQSVQRLKLAIHTPSRGEMGCQAWVTFTGTAGMTVAVKEPKMVAQVFVPETVALGDPIPVTYVVRNIGDTRLEDLHYTFSEIDGPPMPIGDLDQGKEFRTVVQKIARAGGYATYTLNATSKDAPGVSATGRVKVLVPGLEATLKGPGDRTIGNKGHYVLKVINTGELPIENVQARCELPEGLRLLNREGHVQGTTAVVEGTKSRLEVGETYELPFDALAINAGPARVVASVKGNRETKASADMTTTIEGIPAMRMQVVDLSDPVEKGGETTYEVKITNTGSRADSNVKLVCELPKELVLVSSSGPTSSKGSQQFRVDLKSTGIGASTITSVEFEPIAELAPKTEAVYRIRVKALSAGDVRFKAILRSQYLTTPVISEESTRIFGE